MTNTAFHKKVIKKVFDPMIEEPITYHQSVRNVYCFEFLANSTMDKERFLSMGHIYSDDWDTVHGGAYRADIPLIIHGHSIHSFCSTPGFCHEHSYWPSDLVSPQFKAQFEKKWKFIYTSQGWKIP